MPLILVMIVGGFIGILINYFSDVLPVSRRITRPLCRVCNQPYSIKDYLISCRCSTCGNRTSTRSIIVLISAIISCILLKFFPFSILGFWATLPILIFLGVIMVIDIEHRVVLVQTSIFGFVLFFLYGIRLHDLLSTIFGGELRVGDDFVLNPFVEVRAGDGQEIKKMPIFKGRVGSFEAKRRAFAKKSIRFSSLPSELLPQVQVFPVAPELIAWL